MNIKVIISIVLLIAAAGIFYWVYGIDRVPEAAQRGYARLYRDHVLQADEGCDFDFLAARKSGKSI